MGTKPLFPVVRWILKTQLWAIALITIVIWAVWGWNPARSALLGGMAAFLPNALFALRFGSSKPGRAAKDIVRSFYYGETIKLITTAVMFVFIFQLPDIMFAPLFAGFSLVLAVFWFALLARGTDI